MSIKQDILKACEQFIKQNKAYPSRSDLNTMGFNRDAMRRTFGNMNNLLDELGHIGSSYFIELSDIKSKPISKSKKRFVITTAVTGDEVCEKSLASVRSYCKKQNAELLILISKGSNKSRQTLDITLERENIIVSDVNLNNNFKLLTLTMASNKVDPTGGGITRVGKRDSSVVVASPKQRLVYSATGIDKMPHAAMGTGSITKSNYDNTKLNGFVADKDHVMGGLIVEIESDELFHFRQIQFIDGAFVDLGVLYDGKKTKKVSSSMVLGDWHSGATCPNVALSSVKLSKTIGVKEWILHDTFDAASISHHNEGRFLLKSMMANKQKLSLEKELTGLCGDFNYILKNIQSVVVVRSNHDEHLNRYLDEGRFLNDPHNAVLALELASKMVSGLNPIQWYVESIIGKGRAIRWLKRDESYLVSGIECGAHGDKGANGSRGSAASLEKAFGSVVYGHAHTPNILRQAWCVGTSTLPFPDYGNGPSSWMNTHCVIYETGHRQLINLIDGRYTLEE